MGDGDADKARDNRGQVPLNRKLSRSAKGRLKKGLRKASENGNRE